MNLYRNKLSVLYNFVRHKATLPKTSNLQKCGQPTFYSHPHLIKQGEVVPNIKSSEFQLRRQNLIDLILKNSTSDSRKPHVIVIPSATKKYMSDRIPYVFRQNSDYLYLSGCLEPDSCLVLHTKENSSDHLSTLFVKNPDSHSELWDGPSTSSQAAPSLFGVDMALPMSEFRAFLHSYILTNKQCGLWYEVSNVIQPNVDKIVREICQELIKMKLESPIRLIHELRLIKSPAEIELMKKSCEIASDAFHKTMSISKPNITEHELFATMDYECRINGAEYLAYPPVVAGGERATTIHYINNNQVISNGELVLMDAGCEYHGYSSDITRTWPINGKFSSEQKLLYDIIQDVQSELLKMLNTFPTLDNLFDVMCELLGRRLQDVGLITNKGSSEQVIKSAYQFCPHHVSHYLGMDVHDTSTIPRNIPVRPGMIITMEPGIYINERHNVGAEFKGLGIRIEDDVLITENGPVILSEKCVKDPAAIETIFSR